MKSAITCGLVLAIVVLGFLAAAPTAYAVSVSANHSGTICKNYNAGEVTLIDYLANGTRSYKTSATSVICPLTRNTSNSNGANVYVEVTHTGTQTTACTAYSHNSNGTLLALATSGNQTFSGHREIAINLQGAGKSNPVSEYSVLCTIPGNGMRSFTALI